jgi:predicted nuclease of restriction endonuclease-like (RecB) superfamily
MEKNKLIETIDEKQYEKELVDIKKRINETYKKISYTVNSELIILYYEIGSYINSHKSWGSKYVQKLSEDLKEYEGIGYRNLKYMSQLSSNFTYDEIRHQLGAQIPWRTLIEIMSKCESKESRLWYINKTYENSWSRSMLIKQIKAKAYERNTIEPIVSKGIKDYDNPLIKEMIKDTYSLNISRKDFNNEKEFKDKIIDDIIEFLKELGQGYALLGREYEIKNKSKKKFKLDILMYNVLLHSYIAIEIKIGEYKPEYYGQLKNYVLLVDQELKSSIDNKTIGVLICRDGDRNIIKTTFDNDNVPLVFSRYVLEDKLNEYFKK